MSLFAEKVEKFHFHILQLPKIHCSLHLNQMADIITQNKELWDEFKRNLQKRQVCTSLGTKEFLFAFLQNRMKVIEEPTNSIDKHINDSKIN